VQRIRRGASIAALFHAEGTPDVVAELLARDITAYSFEYFQDDDGVFPLMAATGEIAGEMAVIYAAYHLQSIWTAAGYPCPPAHMPPRPAWPSSGTETPDGQQPEPRWPWVRRSLSAPGMRELTLTAIRTAAPVRSSGR
jgi:hypothetical protein